MPGLPSLKDCPYSRVQLFFGALLIGVVAAVLIGLAVTHALRLDPSESGSPPEGELPRVPMVVHVGEYFRFHSPNFPHGYPPYQHTEWYFKAAPGAALTLVCHDVRLSWFTHLYVTDGDITQRLTCYDCAQPMAFTHEFSSAEAVVGLHNRLFFTAPGFNCTMTAAGAAPDCNCGLTHKERIVGGTESVPHEYPWMAGISLVDSSWIFCGGSLITDRHVLTAAHCTKNLTANEMAVSLGLHNTNNQPLHKSDVLQLVVHPGFDENTLVNDMAVLEIRPVEFAKEFRIRPICLPSGSGSHEGKLGLVIGWGTTEYEGFMSHVLLEVPQRVISNAQCRRYYGNQIVPSMLCAGGILNEDACQGDSGGPLFVRSPAGAAEVLGLVSFGLKCGVMWPGVYTRVPSFIEWLEATISEGLQCPPPPEL